MTEERRPRPRRRTAVESLAASWRADAEVLRRYGIHETADNLERQAGEMEAAVRADGEAPLTLIAAARESGYSTDRLRHLVAEGRIPNAGEKGSPRIRRSDLPRKPSSTATFDPRAAASRILRNGE